MALRAVLDHPKFADLQGRLKRPRYVALGCLEAIWHFAGRYTPQGNIGKYSDQTIETWVGWDGNSGDLVSALIDSGWIDRSETYRLLVHDWPEHADKSTKNALRRSHLDFCTDAVPQIEHGVRTPSPDSGTASRLPGPVPEPVPVPEPEAVNVQSRSPLSDPTIIRSINLNDDVPPSDANELQCSMWFWEQIGQATDSGTHRITADSLRLYAKHRQMPVNLCTVEVLARAKLDLDQGVTINRFWFSDGSFKKKHDGEGNGSGTKPSKADERKRSNREKLEDALRARHGDSWMAGHDSATDQSTVTGGCGPPDVVSEPIILSPDGHSPRV